MKNIKKIIFLMILISSLVVGYFGYGAYAGPANTNEIIALTNNERVSRGISPLNTDSRLNSAAYNRLVDMLAQQYWSHTNPQELNCWDFMNVVGYPYYYYGENLTRTQATSEEIVAVLMNSPDHRANILNANYRDIGVAVDVGRFQGFDNIVLSCQEFGSQGNITESVPQNIVVTAEPVALDPVKVTPKAEVVSKMVVKDIKYESEAHIVDINNNIWSYILSLSIFRWR